MLILLNYCPDVRGGRNDVLAILFDMNTLFERFIYAQLKRAEARQGAHQITFEAQASRTFWAAKGLQKSIRPDIIAKIGSDNNYEHVILDTKWKNPSDGKPGDADLHQMHSYNIQFGVRRSYLLYPKVGEKEDIRGAYCQSKAPQMVFRHGCGMIFIELFKDDGKLRDNLGQKIADMLIQEYQENFKAVHGS